MQTTNAFFVLLAALIFLLPACSGGGDSADGDTGAADGDVADRDENPETPDTDDDIADGDAADGDVTDEGETDGDLADGDETDGDLADQDPMDDDPADEDPADEDESDGDVPDGDETDGDVPDGDETDGDVPDGDDIDCDVQCEQDDGCCGLCGGETSSFCIDEEQSESLLCVCTGSCRSEIVSCETYCSDLGQVLVGCQEDACVCADVPDGDVADGDLTDGDDDLDEVEPEVEEAEPDLVETDGDDAETDGDAFEEDTAVNVCSPNYEIFCDQTHEHDNGEQGAALFDAYACLPGIAETGPEVVYRFTSFCEGTFTAELVGAEPGVNLDLLLLDYCNDARCYDKSAGPSGAETLTFALGEFQTRYLIVEGRSGGVGGYSLSMTCACAR